MISLYIQINILIAAAWIVFQLLPKKYFSYRASKKIAQGLLLSSILVMPLLFLLPDISFPNFAPTIELTESVNADGSTFAVAPVKTALEKVKVAAEVTPQRIAQSSSIWLWIFFSGMFAMFAIRIKDWLSLHRLFRDTVLIHQIGRTKVVLSDEIAVPFSVLHFNKAYVVLPTGLIPHRNDFRIALKHEVEHHRRRDTFWALALEWMICGFYLNPAIYLWRKTILQLQELACDEALISRMGISKHAYGSCLLRVAEMALDRGNMWAGTTCMIPFFKNNSHSFLRRRMKMFAQHERSKAKKAVGVAIGTLSILTVIAGAYVAQAASRSGLAVNPGKAVYDSRIQPIAEDSLRKGMALHNASAGFAIVADPNSGKILAVANINNGFDKKLKGDWALSYPLEPGSALKPLIVASALQNHYTKLDDTHICDKNLSTANTVVESSNSCMKRIAKMMGANAVADALHDFGIGSGETVNQFPGASPGHLPEVGVVSDDEYIDMASMGIAGEANFYVTPLEMIQAYSAIANGGKLMKSITSDGKIPAETLRNVLSVKASSQMRDTLRRVVTDGTGQRINGGSIHLAGKTSTVIINGNQRVGGFIGYSPADNPKYVLYVQLFDLKGKEKVGSNTAGPVIRELSEKIFGLNTL